MISLYDAAITDSLPGIIGNQNYAKALAFAIRNQIRKLIAMSNKTLVYARIDGLNDDILDILAVDLKVIEYRQDFSLEVKRALIKNALNYWATAGTKEATEKIVSMIFGDAEINEWYEYDGDPGYFRIAISDASIPDSAVNDFKVAAENTKRLSAWLDKVQLVIDFEPLIQKVGFIICENSDHTLRQQHESTQFYGFTMQELSIHSLKQEEK